MMNGDMDEIDDTWTPPTEAELKVLQAKRERADKISHIMGQYLLRGYKMLNSTCPHCATILLEDRAKELYCVACSEVDHEHTKDDPALDGAAARRQIQESDHRSSESEPNERDERFVVVETNVEILPKVVSGREPETEMRHQENSYSKDRSNVAPWLEKSECQLQKTLRTATDDLARAQGVEECIRYCTLIKTSAEALLALKSLKNTPD